MLALFTLFSLLLAAMGMPQFGGPPPPPHGHFPFPPPPPPPGLPIPDFLMDVNEKAHREHLQLFMENEGKTKAELRDALEKWAEKNGVKEEYEKFMSAHEEKRKAFHELVAANLAGDALAAFNKIWAILENDQISRSDECEQVRTVNDQLKMRIRELVPFIAPKIPGPPPPGCLPPPPPPFHPPPPPPGPFMLPKKASNGMKSFEEKQ